MSEERNDREAGPRETEPGGAGRPAPAGPAEPGTPGGPAEPGAPGPARPDDWTAGPWGWSAGPWAWGAYGRLSRRRDRYYRHRGYGPFRDPARRPGWWPAGEPWPPEGPPAWHHVRRRFLFRLAFGFLLFMVFAFAVPLVLVGALFSATGLGGEAPVVAAALVVVGLVIVAGSTAGGARRFAMPIGDLVEAAGRVEAGDYSARVTQPRRAIRELRLLVDSFNSMAAHLEVDEEQRRTLLADVSHELRTPLAVLRGELEAMIDGIHPADAEHLAETVAQVEVVAQLVEDLRTLALAEAGTLPLHREQTDLAVLARDVGASFEAVAAKSGVRVETAVEGDPPLFEVDPLRIRQVLVNLVANALRYAPGGTAVTIALSAGSGRVACSVIDHGRGIDPALLPRLFERYERSEESRGSGLGLAIARRLVEAHGGSIGAAETPGGGTTVTFELPA